MTETPQQDRIDTAHLRDYSQLRRSPTDRKVAGVAGGLGRHLNIDPTILRIGFVAVAIVSAASARDSLQAQWQVRNGDAAHLLARSLALRTLAPLLREALEELEKDMDFLLAGDVFVRDQLEAYMALKWEEVYAYEHTPHPVEYQMYYSC